jgi:uncharacterized protein (DUF1015 family)
LRALRPTVRAGPALAARLSPPYDVIDDAERTALEAADPANAVRLILPRDRPGEPGSRYDEAARTLRAWRADGTLTREDAAGLYVYELTEGPHTLRGLIGAVALADPDAGIILPHENTMAGPVADRLALTRATAANLEPIFLLYDGGGPAGEIVATTTAGPPLLATTTSDGITHRVWSIIEPAALATVAADLLPRHAVIADGHHRYATYRRYQAERHAAGDGPGPWDFGLTFLVDARASGPRVHAIHRVVTGIDLAEAERRAAAVFRATPLDLPADDGPGLERALADAHAGRRGSFFVVSDGTKAVLLTEPDADVLAGALPADRSAAFRALDVTVAHYGLIGAVWGLPDTEEVVAYHHDAGSAIAAVAAAAGPAVALLLNPTPAAAVAAVAAAGERMPRKSTLFTPKPRTGLVIRPLD